MNTRFAPILIASLLGTTAFVPASVAQEATEGASCESLSVLIEENSDRLQEAWVAEATSVVQSGDEANCTTYYEQANAALSGQAEGGEAEADARIVVTQPDAAVSVEQPAPEVSVTQPQPEVTVNQGRPEIIVRQAPPTVRIQIPRPTISIEQPQPEIIVRMPTPQVGVTTPEPEVEVRQAEPQVRVEQAEPQIEVEAAPGSDGAADVQVQQGEAQVQQQPAAGEPQVQVQRQDPQVQFEAADPIIEYEDSGEPEVQYSRSGEPMVTFENMEGEPQGEQQPASAAGQDGTQQPAAGEQPDAETGTENGAETAPAEGEADAAATQEGAADADTAASAGGEDAAEGEAQQQSVDQDVTALLVVEQPEEAGEPQPYAAGDVIGQQLVNANGDSLGTVERLVMVNNEHYVVLGQDSPLSDGQGGVVLPLEHISIIGGQLVMRGMTEADLTELQGFDGSGAEDVGADQQVEIGTR